MNLYLIDGYYISAKDWNDAEKKYIGYVGNYPSNRVEKIEFLASSIPEDSDKIFSGSYKYIL